MKRLKEKEMLLPFILLAGLLAATVLGLCTQGYLPKTGPQATELVFSEICTKNGSVIADNDGVFRDYVELYNGGADINLRGFYLTDGTEKSEPFGDMPLPSGAYCLLFLDKTVTGFSLKAAGGENLSLVNPAGQAVARVTTVAMTENQVMLYGEPEYSVSQTATPGFANNREGLQAFREGAAEDNPVLRISEVLTENVSALPDEMGRFSDAVELYNSGSEPVFLGEYCLSDSADNRFRYRLPNKTVAPGSFVIIYCDGENYLGKSGEIHANFGITRGDTLCLTDRNGRYTTLPAQFPGDNISMALDSEGNYVQSSVSLGFANDDRGVSAFEASRMAESSDLVVSEVLLSASGVPYQGKFADAVEIWNRSDKTVDTTGWYLSDGGDPYSCPLPGQKLEPGARIVLPCTRENAGFALSREDTLCLLSPQWKWASRVSCGTAQPGQSIQLTDRDTYVLDGVSLGYENTKAGVAAYEKERLPGGLRISELMSANASYLKGAYGKTSDWVELYNGSSQTVNLKDYTLSTDSGNLNAFVLPDKTLYPGQYCILLLAERDGAYLRGYTRLPVNLSSSGEAVYLSRGGELVDYAVIPELPTDISYGRERGTGGFACLAIPTPGQGNGDAVTLSEMPRSATAQGVYNSGVEVELSGSGVIYYTIDCTTPTADSLLYTGPISLTETAVIRAVNCEPGKLPSQPLDLTFVINEGHSLPVVSMVLEPDDLWDEETGIYVKGPNASPDFPHEGANFWQPWEKASTVSLFELDGGGFSVPCGVSIFGAYSRALSMKGFSCTFRDCYGAGALNYALFGDAGLAVYESFVLRCSGQDFDDARMRDVLMTSLVADHTNVAVQKYRPVALYLNGEFWGVYYIREKAQENYVAGNYNVTREEVVMTGANGVDIDEYMDLIQFAHNNDLSVKKNYEYVCSLIDEDEYIDYIIAEMYIANPDNGNIRYFKTPTTEWTWILYDTDYGFADVGFNTVVDHLNPDGTGAGDAFSTKLINALLKNPEFKDKFIRRMAWQLNTIWTKETVWARIDELETLIGEDMKLDCAKWGRSYANWQRQVEKLRNFAVARNEKFPQYIQQYFNLSDSQMREYGFGA